MFYFFALCLFILFCVHIRGARVSVICCSCYIIVGAPVSLVMLLKFFCLWLNVLELTLSSRICSGEREGHQDLWSRSSIDFSVSDLVSEWNFPNCASDRVGTRARPVLTTVQNPLQNFLQNPAQKKTLAGVRKLTAFENHSRPPFSLFFNAMFVNLILRSH